MWRLHLIDFFFFGWGYTGSIIFPHGAEYYGALLAGQLFAISFLLSYYAPKQWQGILAGPRTSCILATLTFM